MTFYPISKRFIQRAEKRVGVAFDYVHQIARSDFSLLMRYNKIFGFLDPNRKSSSTAYHVARLRGALAADCGTCVEAEINLAKASGVEPSLLSAVILGDYSSLPKEFAAVAELSDSVVRDRIDNAEARDIVIESFGEAALIEICFAMNGANLLPGIKRGMGFATACDLSLMRKLIS